MLLDLTWEWVFGFPGFRFWVSGFGFRKNIKTVMANLFKEFLRIVNDLSEPNMYDGKQFSENTI